MKTLATVFLTFSALVSMAQFDPDYKSKRTKELLEDDEPSMVNGGVGLGLSYGGIGARVSIFPVTAIGVFGAVGYNLHKAGYNAGAIARILPKKKICPVFMAMYGYNGVIVVQGADEYNKTYYGPTFGPGMEVRFRNNQNYLNVEILVPVRSQEWRDDVDALMNNPSIEMTEPLPFAISIGYHIKF